jgi:hypothetical protein
VSREWIMPRTTTTPSSLVVAVSLSCRVVAARKGGDPSRANRGASSRNQELQRPIPSRGGGGGADFSFRRQRGSKQRAARGTPHRPASVVATQRCPSAGSLLAFDFPGLFAAKKVGRKPRDCLVRYATELHTCSSRSHLPRLEQAERLRGSIRHRASHQLIPLTRAAVGARAATLPTAAILLRVQLLVSFFRQEGCRDSSTTTPTRT